MWKLWDNMWQHFSSDPSNFLTGSYWFWAAWVSVVCLVLNQRISLRFCLQLSQKYLWRPVRQSHLIADKCEGIVYYRQCKPKLTGAKTIIQSYSPTYSFLEAIFQAVPDDSWLDYAPIKCHCQKNDSLKRSCIRRASDILS